MFYFDPLPSSTLTPTNKLVVTYTDMNITTTINTTTVNHSQQDSQSSSSLSNCKITAMTPSTKKDTSTVTLGTTNISIRRKSSRAGRNGRDTTLTTVTTVTTLEVLELKEVRLVEDI